MAENFNELLQLADNGDMAAQEKVGTAYFKGNGVEKDIKKAIDYFAKAADNGSGLGCYQLGRAFETGTGAPIDIEEAIKCYERSAELGYQNAVNKLKTLKEQHQERPIIETGNTYIAPQLPGITYNPPQPVVANPNYTIHQQTAGQPKSKTTASLLALFLGVLGIHNFYLGYKKKAVIQLILTITLFGTAISAIWALVEFIMILTGSIPNDAKGIRLA